MPSLPKYCCSFSHGVLVKSTSRALGERNVWRRGSSGPLHRAWGHRGTSLGVQSSLARAGAPSKAHCWQAQGQQPWTQVYRSMSSPLHQKVPLAVPLQQGRCHCQQWPCQRGMKAGAAIEMQNNILLRPAGCLFSKSIVRMPIWRSLGDK